MQNSKKQDLFRFITTRAPEVISDSRIDLGFIYHPDEANSYFLDDLTGVTDVVAGRAILDGLVGSYTSNVSPQVIKDLDPALWKFSDWLVKNKGNLSRIAVDANAVTLPSSLIILEIWDDMLYDVLTKKNPNIRETCLQLIIAINFLQKYTTYSALASTDPNILAQEAKDLKRLAEGKVILHQSFTKAKNTAYAPVAYGLTSSYKRHETLHKARISSMCAAKLKAVKGELAVLDKTHKAEFKAAHDNALGAYQSQVKQVVDNYLAANPNAVANATINVEKVIKTVDVSKVTTKELVKTLTQAETDLEHILPAGLVDNFEFSFSNPLTKSYAQSKISKKALGYVEKNLLEDHSVEMVSKRLQKEINECEKMAFAVFRKRPKEMLVNGIPVKTNGLGLRDFSISFHEVVSEVDGSISYSIYFSVDAGQDNAYIRSGSFSVKMGGSTYSTTDFQMHSNVSETIFGELFTDGSITTLPENALVEFDATFELNNGQEYTIDAEGLTSADSISGSAAPTKSGITNPDLHYGVNTIGVADYRKVEQELCCYVPGEVAHIENIMAREYMEKSTRSLTRMETSTSSETEKEKEEEYESTETTRNEMSTEVASVITEDQSMGFGFSANVNGSYSKAVSFGAGVSGDFSMGKSASDSSSAARTMAEDITRRALERITQKITSKRTSTMLREFEEKNSHGFDNRAGDKHVTGVYRWIDKIYKNRIVNYGKRLIYEFMIPEPARFYKEALIIKAEESPLRIQVNSNNSDDVLIKPSAPSTYGINNASELTRANFAGVAAEYGVNVTAPPEEFANQSIAFGEAIGTNDKEQSFTYDTLIIPGEYECYRIAGKLDCSYKSKSAEYGFVKCIVAGVSHGVGYGKSEGWQRFVEFDFTAADVEGTVSLVVNCFKTTAYAGSLVAHCKLKTSVFEKWQQEVYRQITQAYEEQMDAYKAAEKLAKEEQDQARQLREQMQAASPKDTQMVTNSKFNGQRVNTELKRLCIEMLTKPFGFVMGKDFYQNGTHNIPEIKLGSTLDTYSSYVKFFEQAFDWEIMAQKFYPFYWADRSDWIKLFQTQDGLDYSYQAFLQSGMGRVVVPVREGFEDAVTYFMETGEVWNGSGMVIDTNDKLYLSIVDETTNIEGTVEGQEWETTVPTTLQILQGRSVFLDEEGLPCCVNDESSTLLADTNVLNAEPPADPPA